MQPVSSRIWTRVAVFISYDDNNYTTGTSYGCTTWTLRKRRKKKLHRNNTRMLFWSHPGSNTPRHNSCTASYFPSHKTSFWKSKGKLIRDVILWTSTHGRDCVGRPTRTCFRQICAYARCSLEDLPGAADDRDRWGESEGGEQERERERGGKRQSAKSILAVTWWWWWWWIPLGKVWRLINSLHLVK